MNLSKIMNLVFSFEKSTVHQRVVREVVLSGQVLKVVIKLVVRANFMMDSQIVNGK
jgi:hypothetical protein